MASLLVRSGIAAVVTAVSACASLIGIDDFVDGIGGATGSAGAAATGGAAGSAGAAGLGGTDTSSGGAGGAAGEPPVGGGGSGPAPGTILWARSYPAPNGQSATGVAVGPDGELFVGGAANGPFDLGPSASVAANQDDLFVARVADGDGRAAVTIAATNTPFLTSLEYSPATSELAIGGAMSSPLVIGANVIEQIGYRDLYALRLSADLGWVWGQAYGSASNNENDGRLAVLADGSLAVSTAFTGDVWFADKHVATSGSYSDVAVARVDATGAVPWARRDGGSFSEGLTAIGTGVGPSIVLGGRFRGTASIAGASLSTSTSTDDAFIALIRPNGTAITALQLHSSPLASVAAAAAGLAETIVVGSFNGEITLGGTSYQANGTDCFITALLQGGSELWTLVSGTQGQELVRDVAVGPDGTIYLVGMFTSDLGLGSSLFAGSTYQGFVLAIEVVNEQPTVRWEYLLDGPDTTELTAVDVRDGRLAVAGTIRSTSTLGGFTLDGSADGLSDVVVAEIVP